MIPMTRKYVYPLIILWSLALSPSIGFSQPQTPTPPIRTSAATFSSSPAISARPFPDEQRELLVSLLTLPDRHQMIERARKKLCPAIVTLPPQDAKDIKTGLAVAETSMSVEVSFAREATPESAITTPFSLLIDFRDDDLFIRTSQPRFPSEAGGFALMPQKSRNSDLWIEGKHGSNILILLPPLAQCRTRAVAICPRSFVPRVGLQNNGYFVSGARYFYSVNADGLLIAPKENPGRIRASIRASSRIPLPNPWFEERLSEVNPSATLKHIITRSTDEAPQFDSLTLPSAEAVEASLELGRGDELLRTISNRSTIEISQFELPTSKKVEIHFAETPVEAGTCFMVTRWSETQL